MSVRMLDTIPAPPGPNGNGTSFGLAVAPSTNAVYFVGDGNNTLNLLHDSSPRPAHCELAGQHRDHRAKCRAKRTSSPVVRM